MWQKESYQVKEFFCGEGLTLNVHKFMGKQPGPTIYVQASLHGAELQGNAVILSLIDHLKQKEFFGQLTLVPLCNPWATLQKHGTYTFGRVNPVTGNNWNRNFFAFKDICSIDELRSFAAKEKSSEWRKLKSNFKIFLAKKIDETIIKLQENNSLNENNYLNLLLQKFASSADLILDLHTGPNATQYLYCPEYQIDLCHYALFKYVLKIPNQFDTAMDEACFDPWLSLQSVLNSMGREDPVGTNCFTLELGSEESFSMELARTQLDSILNLFSYFGALKEKIKKSSFTFCELKDFKTIYAPKSALYDYVKNPGEFFISQEPLANAFRLGSLDAENGSLSCHTPIKAPCDGVLLNRCPSANVLQGMELLQFMSNCQTKQPS